MEKMNESMKAVMEIKRKEEESGVKDTKRQM